MVTGTGPATVGPVLFKAVHGGPHSMSDVTVITRSVTPGVNDLDPIRSFGRIRTMPVGTRDRRSAGTEVETMKRTHFLFLVATGAAAVIALAGCGSSNNNSTNTGSGGAPAGGAPAQLASLRTAQTSTLGTIVTDSKGMTVYRYDKDTASPSMSNCTGQCASNWPPVAASSGTLTVEGVDKSLVGTITRADGTKQMTLAGWPLYTFVGDTKAGDVTGQGKGNSWFAATTSGGKAATQGSAQTTGGSSKY
jgi:predicted lipoprotein with Yx(FWY)xxD motif